MKFKVSIGSLTMDVIEATPAEALEFARGAQPSTPKVKDIVSTTKNAIVNATPAKTRKRTTHILWTTPDLLFLAKTAVTLGPDANRPATIIARTMLNQPSNLRNYDNLYSMSYDMVRYLKDGTKGNFSQKKVDILTENGYPGGMMSKTHTNFLGNTEESRRLEVRQA